MGVSETRSTRSSYRLMLLAGIIYGVFIGSRERARARACRDSRCGNAAFRTEGNAIEISSGTRAAGDPLEKFRGNGSRIYMRRSVRVTSHTWRVYTATMMHSALSNEAIELNYGPSPTEIIYLDPWT